MKPLNWFFEQLFPSISSQCLRSSSGSVCTIARDSRGTEKRGATVNMEPIVAPTEFLVANPISQTDAEVQGNLLREYEQEFAELLEQEKLTKLCSNAGFSKNIEKGQFFTALDEYTLHCLKGSCREYTLPRSEESTRSHPGCEGLFSSRTSRCGDHDRIFISWQNYFLGSCLERNKQIRNRNVRRNICCKCWRH